MDVGELTDVRIPEHKSLIQLVFHPVHLAPDDAEQRFAIDQDLDPILLYRLVKFSRFVHIFEVIC